MTLPGIGTTAGAQYSNQSIAATSDANGNISFVGPSGIQGSTITAVVTVPNVPPGANFTAMLGAANGMGMALQNWFGVSTAGKFQIGVGQTLVVTGAGLLANTQYSCTFSQIIDVGATQVVIPEPNSSVAGNALSPSLIAAGSGEVDNGASAGSAQVLPPVPGHSYRLISLTVIITAASSTSGTNGIFFQAPTGALPPPAGSQLFTFPATTASASFLNAFNGFPTTPGNGLYFSGSTTGPYILSWQLQYT